MVGYEVPQLAPGGTMGPGDSVYSVLMEEIREVHSPANG